MTSKVLCEVLCDAPRHGRRGSGAQSVGVAQSAVPRAHVEHQPAASPAQVTHHQSRPDSGAQGVPGASKGRSSRQGGAQQRVRSAGQQL